MTEQQWTDTLYALSKGKCIVLLGAGASTFDRADGQAVPLTEGLALRLAGLLAEKGHDLEPDEERSLLNVATEFKTRCGMMQLNREVELFYQENAQKPSELLRLMAELPVAVFINTAPDTLLKRAFKNRFRVCHVEHYRYKKEGKKAAELPEPSPERPLIYNLFGSTDDPDSLVLTEGDRLQFLEDTIQNNGSIPNGIIMEMTADKTLLFLGFDFEQWHLRILSKTLFKADKLAMPTLVPNGPKPLARGTALFFKKQYKMEFLPTGATEFARQLAERWKGFEKKQAKTANGGQAPLEVFYMYDRADETFKNELDKHLATLRRDNSISTWDESKLEPGAEATAATLERLARANVILMLVSSDFLANDRIYEQQLRLAIERSEEDGRVLICPILVRHCAWEGAIFAKMHTVLPLYKKPVASWEDRDAAYREIARQLGEYFEGLVENLKNARP